MPKVTGVFDYFSDLDKLSIDNISSWIKSNQSLNSLENYIANLSLYSQVVPINENEQEIDLAIFREAIKKVNVFYKKETKKIIIPESIITRFGNLNQLIWIFIDTYKPDNLTSIIVASKSHDEVLGTYIAPVVETAPSILELVVEGKKYSIKSGSLIILPCSRDRCHINFQSNSIKLLNKNEGAFEVFGGKLGLVVDIRGKDAS